MLRRAEPCACIDYGTEKREGEKEKDSKYIGQETGDCYAAFATSGYATVYQGGTNIAGRQPIHKDSPPVKRTVSVLNTLITKLRQAHFNNSEGAFSAT